MISVNGLNKFRDFFKEYNNNYVLIGGTACAIIFDEIGEDVRATKDLDIVLIVENINIEFGKKLWEFIKDAGYTIEVGQEKRCFYRFKGPKSSDYPKMIELFSRNESLILPEESHIIPISISDEISSLSAILLNNDYYDFMISGKRIIDDISVLDEKHLIPFKAKAWCELIERKNSPEDRRKTYVYATDKGRNLLQEDYRRFITCFFNAGEKLGKEKTDLLNSLLEEFSSYLEKEIQKEAGDDV